jgi:3-phosphoshikimate 1-carboxyvinyltransferase
MPYILMTQNVMKYFGASVSMEGTTLKIDQGAYKNRDITIEPDWSAASYWYEIAALNRNSDIKLKGLQKNSLQGDSIIAEMMQQFGVTSGFDEDGVDIQCRNAGSYPSYFSYDFTGCPDLGPAVAAACAGLNITADLHGLKNFRLKESDRASSLQRELYNMNVKTDFCGGSKFKLYSGSGLRRYPKPVKTYNDHRIAMTFAALAVKTGNVTIENCKVVEKSYPNFYKDLEGAGFRVEFR